MTGVILCGGISSRMGREKCFIPYHGIEQWRYIYNIMQQSCEKIIISCNASQAGKFNNAEIIIDDLQYKDCGPAAGVLSVFDNFPSSTYLVIGCDYPYFTNDNLELMLTYNFSTSAVYNIEASLYEPLLAIYKKDAIIELKQQFIKGNYSLQYLLKQINACKIFLPAEAYRSIDNASDYEIALSHFNTEY
jgi:molybdenum cofactor guanylyltransferase